MSAALVGGVALVASLAGCASAWPRLPAGGHLEAERTVCITTTVTIRFTPLDDEGGAAR